MSFQLLFRKGNTRSFTLTVFILLFIWDIEAREIDKFLLPKSHPLNFQLHRYFKNTKMFRSKESLEKEGFKVKMGHRQLMVASHPSCPGFLFKKFIDDRPQNGQLENFIKRIKGAQKVEKAITSRGFKQLLVPKKWLYELPKSFSLNGNSSYILIVEDMNILDDINPPGENSRKYYNMPVNLLTELCIILHDLNGCDAFPRNQPFTHSGKIAFVDTEHVGEKKGHFVKHIVPALNEELRKYAIALWQKLENE